MTNNCPALRLLITVEANKQIVVKYQFYFVFSSDSLFVLYQCFRLLSVAELCLPVFVSGSSVKMAGVPV